MSLPIYQKIIIDENNADTIFTTILQAPIGSVPCYLSLETIADDQKNEVIDLIYQSFLTLELNDSFPYPTYIVSHIKNDQVPIRQFSSINGLPRFFMNKIKRLNQKENQILNMNKLKAKRLNNLINPEKLTVLNSQSLICDELKMAVDQSDFLIEILNNLKKDWEI